MTTTATIGQRVVTVGVVTVGVVNKAKDRRVSVCDASSCLINAFQSVTHKQISYLIRG